MKSDHLEIFGVQIPSCRRESVYSKVKDVLVREAENPFFIVTLNPEILLKTEKDSKYAQILNNADLKIVDGAGLKLAAFLKGEKTGERIAGADLAEYILDIAKKENLKTTFILKKDGFTKKDELEKYLLGSNYKNFFIGLFDCKGLDNRVSIPGDTRVLLVGLGAPVQEKYIWNIKASLPKLKLAIGVGGTFDYWTGKKKRAPLFFRKFGLEWLWRLAIQPNRIGRIWNATFVFIYKAITK